ncbi:MAG: nucleotidyltransferase domain-containing protein, partial [Bacteroidota bacterium]
MTIQDLKDRNLVLLECISGSKSYSLDIPTSDTDIKGVFLIPKSEFYGANYVPQVANETNDIVYYELGRFIELLGKNNPSMLELLATPSDKILYKHDLMNRIDLNLFLSKKCKDTFGGYAFTQVRKARGRAIFLLSPREIG